MTQPVSPVLGVLRRTCALDALEACPQGAIAVGLDGVIAWCNAAASSVLQRAGVCGVVGKRLAELSTPDGCDPSASGQLWQSLLEGGTWTGEVVNAGESGREMPLRVSRSPIFDEDGTVVGVLSLATDLRDELRAKEALSNSEERIAALLQYSSDVAMVFDSNGLIAFVSPSVERVAGWRPDQLVGQNGWDFLHPEDVAANMDLVAEVLGSERPVTREWRLRRADGTYGWFAQTLSDLRHVPAIGGVIGNFRDVTERHAADEARKQSELILTRVVEVTSDAFIGIDREGVVTEWNPAAERLFGWPSTEAIGHDLSTRIIPEHDRRRFRRMFVRFAAGEARRFLEQPFEMMGQSRNGQLFPVEVSLVQVTVDERSHFRAFVRNIAERKAAEARLAHQALTDALTGLPNRTLLRDRLTRAVSRLARHPSSVAVMFLDLDRFKLVNDGLGHDAGDELLTEVAARLLRSVRDIDTVARYGGDEFVIIIEDAGTIADVRQLAERILETVAEPLVVGGRELHPRASIGIALTAGDMARPDDLVRDADIAMYRAKELGGQSVEIFETVMQSRAVVRFELERDLRQAIESSLMNAEESDGAGRLLVFYQPIVSFDGATKGVEALVRWDHPSFGLMAPAEFIPLAEETGLIAALGRYVLGEAARQTALWRATVAPNLSVSVNISARQLDEVGLPRLVASILAETGLDAASLCIELTETTLLRDSGLAAATLHELRKLGVRVAIDDFGTGYSSLVYLRRFPVQVVKLDRSFVSGVPTSAEDAAIVSAVINLAHALGMEAVAEGIETDEQRVALANLGCELGQGYLWSTPRPASDLTEMLSNDALLMQRDASKDLAKL
ncbi:MAG: EAL domain-containing protein [Acidimicrobiales bacterium]